MDATKKKKFDSYSKNEYPTPAPSNCMLSPTTATSTIRSYVYCRALNNKRKSRKSSNLYQPPKASEKMRAKTNDAPELARTTWVGTTRTIEHYLISAPYHHQNHPLYSRVLLT